MYDIPSLSIMDKLTGPMVPQTSTHMADAAAAGGRGPIATASAGVVNDTSSSKLKDEHTSILELADVDLQDLFANMDQDFEYSEAELTKALEHKLEPQTYEQGDQATGDTRGLESERSNTSGSDIQGSGGEIVGGASQDMDDEYDELFEEPLPTKEPATPPLSTPPTPHGELSALSNTPVPPSRADPDLTTVMSNITTLKSAIISNHLLLTRFLHLQSAYRSLNTTLVNERRLRADDKATIARMQEELASNSYDSPLLQFQITQLKEEARKERAIRMQSDATILQYQENIQSLQSQIEKIKKEKTKLEAGEKRAVEAIKTTESLKTRVVGLMSENKNLLQQVESLKAQDGVQEKNKMKEEIVKLKDMVSRLEGNNIRLKAGRSILAGGEGNSAAAIQSLPNTTQKSSTAPMVIPQSPPSESLSNTAINPPPPGPIYITDDDVVVMGTTNALQDFQIVSPTKKAHSTITATSNPPKHSMYSVGRASATPTPGASSANRTKGGDNDVVVLGGLGQ